MDHPLGSVALFVLACLDGSQKDSLVELADYGGSPVDLFHQTRRLARRSADHWLHPFCES